MLFILLLFILFLFLYSLINKLNEKYKKQKY